MIKITCQKGKFNKDDSYCTETCKHKILCAGPENVRFLKGGLPFNKDILKNGLIGNYKDIKIYKPGKPLFSKKYVPSRKTIQQNPDKPI